MDRDILHSPRWSPFEVSFHLRMETSVLKTCKPSTPRFFPFAKKGTFLGLSYIRNGMWNLCCVASSPDLETPVQDVLGGGSARGGGRGLSASGQGSH